MIKKFRFEIQALQKIFVEAETAEHARQQIINRHEDTILTCPCDDFEDVDPSVSDGVEVK